MRLEPSDGMWTRAAQELARDIFFIFFATRYINIVFWLWQSLNKAQERSYINALCVHARAFQMELKSDLVDKS